MEEERKVVILNIDDILPNRFQPRIKFNEAAINELAESIKLHGVIQPIVVRKISDKYEIIAGERRYKASIIAGKTTIPAIITSLDDKNSAEVALIENVQRQDLTPIEEAISYKKILDMGYINQEELGAKLGKKQSTVANKLRLLNLDDEVQEALMENKISERHARSLLKLDKKNQILMLNRIINERLTVRKTDEEIAKLIETSGEQKEIKKGDNMNNDILKDFNIPTEPIVNDSEKDAIEPNVEVPSVEAVMPTPIETIQSEPTPTENISAATPSINPGFMDVDKIQNVAQDIVKEPEPIANMDELLKPTPIAEEEPVAQDPVQQAVEQNVPQGGKFFNMFNFNQPEQDDSFIEDVEEKEVNMNFGEPVAPTPSFNPIEESKEEPMQDPQPQPIVEQPVVQPEPVVENVAFPEPTPIEQPQEPTFTATPEPFSLTDDNDFKAMEQPQEPVQTMTQPEPIVNRPYMMDEDVKFDEEGEIEVQLPNQQEEAVKVDMKTVINTIRECAQKIENFGYKIDTDEIDLSDSYEVTFRIEKN